MMFPPSALNIGTQGNLGELVGSLSSPKLPRVSAKFYHSWGEQWFVGFLSDLREGLYTVLN